MAARFEFTRRRSTSCCPANSSGFLEVFKLLFAGISALFYNGQFFSDEPGLYIEGEFGIRLETVLRWVLTSMETHFYKYLQ